MLLLAGNAGAEPAEALQQEGVLEVSGDLIDDDGDPAEDISGIGCSPAVEKQQTCLLINDEDRSAQFATLRDGGIIVGDKVSLVGNSPPDDAIGTAPGDHGCAGGTKKFKDLDGEGVAYLPGSFFIVGSHGCSRRHDEFRASSFLLVRLNVDEQNRVTKVDRSYRLSEVLKAIEPVRGEFAKTLSGDPGGVNIEGIAADGDRLLIGLRAPVIGKMAYIIPVQIEALFGADAALGAVTPIPVELGAKTGVRDLAMLPDGRMLVLAGPVHDEDDIPYSLFAARQDDSPAKRLATLADVDAGDQRAKAEAVTVLGQEDGDLRVLVLFDGLENGGAREYRFRVY
jgi:hypothetical protein